jgi:hypothetical protein
MTPEDLALTLLGIVATLLASWFYYRKAVRKGEHDRAILESLINSEIRVRDDTTGSGQKRGTVFKKADGTYAVRWVVNAQENIGVSDTVKTEVVKGK